MVTPAQMASSRSISLKCPVPLCTRQFKTNRAKDCLRVHLRYSKDEDHKDIYIARYSDHQRTSAAIYPCPICRQTFEKSLGLKRHHVSIHRYSKSRCPKCHKSFKYPVLEHLNRGRCNAQSGSTKLLSTSYKTKRVNSQYPRTNPSTLTPDITAQHARHLGPAETARNDTVLPIRSELGAAHTSDDVGATTSLLSTFQRDNSNLGQGEPFNEEVVDQRWTRSFGSTYNLDLNQGLLSHDQTIDQQWSGVFGNGCHSHLKLPTSKRSALLLRDNRFQDCSNKVSPDIGRRNPWVETSAYSGYTKVLPTSDLESNRRLYTLSSQADTYITTGLAREDSFNRLSVPLCQRPYGAPIFMHVIHGDISSVYSIIIRGEGSLWDHDPYGLGLLYYAAHYCWRGSGQKCAMAMYSALLDFGVSDGGFLLRTDEIGNRPIETINDWLLASCARGQSSPGYDGVFEAHKSSRGFTQLHKVLLNIDSSYGSMANYLSSLAPEELRTVVDMPDALGRTPLAWAVEYGLPTAVELLLRFGAYPNQLRLTKDGGYSPLIHLAIAGPCSVWMDADILDTVRLLLQAGVDPNGTDHEGWTPLHIAASWSLFNVTDMLERCSQSLLDWQARTFTGESILDVSDNVEYQGKYRGMRPGPMRLT